MNLIYILLGIFVNFIWGLAFFVPYYLKDIDPVLITLSRYLFYGLSSLFLLSLSQPHWRSLTRLDWKNAMIFSFVGNLIYYMALVLAIHYAGIVLPTLIVSALPVTMMIYGNIKNHEFPFRKILFPIILITTGIIGLRWLQETNITTQKNTISIMIGSCWAFLALMTWTWYGVANANYLKKNPTISGYSWSIAGGVCCLLQVIVLIPLYISIKKHFVIQSLANKSVLFQLILAGIILGIIVSWLTTVLWNKISRQLPTTLIGQLLVFETISSLMYGYIHDGIFPEWRILVCITIVIGGIFLGVRATIRS